MSRIGKKNIIIPSGTSVHASREGLITIKGPKGELSRVFKPAIGVKVEDNIVRLEPENYEKKTRALWGSYASHISNMIAGVNELYVKKLSVEGVGYRVETAAGQLTLNLGFSHAKKIEIPDNVTVAVEKNTISIKSCDKESVGHFAARVRAIKPPEPYKGKGIRYENETVRRKQGKKAA